MEGYVDDESQSKCFKELFDLSISGQTKVPGKNEVKYTFKLDNPTTISEEASRVYLIPEDEEDVSESDISWKLSQKNLESIDLFISYNKPIQNRLVQVLLYSSDSSETRRVLA